MVSKAADGWRVRGGKEANASLWAYLPSAGFFFVLLLTLDYPFVLAEVLGSASGAGLLVGGLVAATMLLGVCVAFAGALGMAVVPPLWALPAALVAAVGLLGPVVNLGGGSSGALVMGGALAGAGLLALGLIWGALYARLHSMSDMLACLAASMGAAALAEWIAQLAVPVGPQWVYGVACGVGLVACAVGAARLGSKAAPGEEERLEKAATVDGLRMHSLLADLWPLLCGLGLIFAIVGFTWGDCLFGAKATASEMPQGLQTPFERPFFVALLMVGALVYVRRRGSASLNLAFQILPLVAVSFALITWLLPMQDAGIAVQTYKSFSRAMGFAVFGVGTWLYVCTAIGERSLAPNAVLGLCTAFEACVVLACCLFVDVFSQEMAAAITPCCTVIYLLAVAVFGILENAEHHSTVEASGSLEEACARVATEYGLSPRETEVLAYIARGRSATFIADELHISPHTVKTHSKRIHEKLGLGSKEDIISLIETGIMART